MQKGRGCSHLKNTAYVQRKIWQRNIDACPPVVVPLIPKERCSSLPGVCIKALAIFELQKETKSKTKQIREVYSSKLFCSHLPIAFQDLISVWLLLCCESFVRNLFELQKEVKSSGSLLKQNFLQTRHKRNRGMTLIYRTPVRPGLVGFCLSLGIVLIPRGSKFIQMKFHGTCLVKETDSYRFHLSSWTSLTICLSFKIVLIPRGSKFI